jgi:hypothetical protein
MVPDAAKLVHKLIAAEINGKQVFREEQDQYALMLTSGSWKAFSTDSYSWPS